MKVSNFSRTRETWVYWSMSSLTRAWYPLRRWRQGRSRALSANQAARGSAAAASGGTGGGFRVGFRVEDAIGGGKTA